MGTTYHAQVEVFFPQEEHNEIRYPEIWQIVSRWELEKDYGFARAFHSIATYGWPSDVKEILGETEEKTDLLYYDGKYHVDGKLFSMLEPVDNVEWFTWSESLQHHVKFLITTCKVRVLFWEM